MYLLKKIKTNIKKSEIAKRILYGAFWSLAGTALAKGILLISSIFLAHILGVKYYGELGLVRSTINMFVCFGTVGMGVTASKYISQYLKTDKNYVGKIISITGTFATISGFIISILIFSFSSLIAGYTSTDTELDLEIKIGTIILLATVINGAINGILSGFEDFKHIAINTFISSIIESILIILGAFLYSVIGALIGYGLGTLSLLLLNIYSSHKNMIKNNINTNYRDLKLADFSVIYKFSIPAAISSFLVAPTFWVIRTMVVKYDGMSSLGVYEMADQWKIIILFIPSALSNIILPILSSKNNINEKNDYVKALKYNLSINIIVTLIFAILISFASSSITKFYGPGFENNIPIILLSFSTCFSSIASVFGIAIISKGKVWIGLTYNILWALYFILFSYYALNNGYGINGVALALLLSYFIHSIVQAIYIKYLVKHE